MTIEAGTKETCEKVLLDLLDRVRKEEITFIAAVTQGGNNAPGSLLVGDFDDPLQPFTMIGALRVLQTQLEHQIGQAHIRRAVMEARLNAEAELLEEHKAAGGAVQ